MSNSLLFILRVLVWIVVVPANAQVNDNHANGILNSKNDSIVQRIQDYRDRILAYRETDLVINSYERKVDSMLNVIDRAALTKEHKKAFSDLLNLSRNNTSNDVYLEVQSLDQALILLFNKNIPLTILYDMDRKYYKEVSIREEFNSWESNVSSFLGNKAINYYDAENLLVDDTVFLRELRMYKFHPGEVIADLGAGSGYFERVLSKYSNNLTVYATDIDSAIVTRLTTELAYLEMNDKTNITYISVLGNEKASGLPFKSIDKVIVRNTFHHFSYPNDMLKDCKRIMKENGTLFIVDILVDEATKVPKCNLHLSRKVFLNYLTSNGFVLVNETKLGYDNFKCFEFQIMP